jgi:molybdate transport system ATP-binding protein
MLVSAEAMERSGLSIRVQVRGERQGRPRLDAAIEVGTGITCVTGPSGAGKTTLLSTIAGLVRPEAGRVMLGDRVLFDHEAGVFVPPHRRRVALVFQSLALFPHLSGWRNVAYGLPASTPGAQRRAMAMRWLERARAAHVAERKPATFSGGEAQRVALARALASEPRALLLDEPFSAMDAALRCQLGDDLRELVDGVRIPTILVTHHPDEVARLGAAIVELDAGRIRSSMQEEA